MERTLSSKLHPRTLRKGIRSPVLNGGGERTSSAGSLSSVAYHHLHDEIVSGRLTSGTVLSEAAVAKTLGISRTPVGEAVRQLAREGLVEQVPRFGTVVKSLGRVELIENYEVREAMESYAVALAAKRGRKEDIDRINGLNDVMQHLIDGLDGDERMPVGAATLRRFLAADMAFHLAILQAAGNRRFVEIISMSRSVVRIFSVQRPLHNGRIMRHTHEFHRAIADAVAAGDALSAQQQMLAHLNLSKQQALDSLDQSASRGQAGLVELPEDVRCELIALENSLKQSKIDSNGKI